MNTKCNFKIVLLLHASCPFINIPHMNTWEIPTFRENWIASWEGIAIVFIGSCKVEINDRQVSSMTWHALIVGLIENESTRHTHEKFMQSWPCHHPHLVQGLHDKEGGRITHWQFIPKVIGNVWFHGCLFDMQKSTVEYKLWINASNCW